LRARSRRATATSAIFHNNLLCGPLALNGDFKFIHHLRLSVIKPMVRHGLDNTHSTISSLVAIRHLSTMRDESNSASLGQRSAGLRDRTALIGLIGLGGVRLQLMR
jgi:hypothetical protein